MSPVDSKQYLFGGPAGPSGERPGSLVPTALEAALGITGDDPSLDELLIAFAEERPEQVFGSAEPREIKFQTDLVKDISPDVQPWLHAYLLDISRKEQTGARNMVLKQYMKIHAEATEIHPDIVTRQIGYMEGLLKFNATLGFEHARSAVDLTPDILVHHCSYTVPEAFFMLSEYFTKSITGAYERNGHHRLIQERIESLNSVK
jgi:hypothetical protein